MRTGLWPPALPVEPLPATGVFIRRNTNFGANRHTMVAMFARRHRWLIAVLLAILVPTTAAASDAAECTERSDIVVVIDSSLSVRETSPVNDHVDNWVILKRFVSDLMQQLPLDDHQIRFGIVEFASIVNEQNLLPLDNRLSGAELRQYVEALPFIGGNTNTSGALRVARDLMLSRRRDDVSNIVLLLTDGLSNVDSHLTLAEARITKDAGIRLFTVGVTPQADSDELADIASDPVTYHRFLSPNFTQLNLMQDRLLSRLCTLKRPPPAPCRDHHADIVFILDGSSSIEGNHLADRANAPNWKSLKDFVIAVVKRLKVGTNDTRVAIIRYSSDAEVIFHLDRFDSADDVIERLRRLEYNQGGTNTSGALRTARTRVFRSDYGDRDNVRNIGVIITDGNSDNERATASEAAKIKGGGVRMFAIGVTHHVLERELVAIASTPAEDHVNRVEQFDAVDRLISSLVWKICNDRVRTRDTVCSAGLRLVWLRWPGHLIVGHNAARLTGVTSPAECQRLCLQEPACRSVDYVPNMHECAISYDDRQTAPASFLPEAAVDYYEWRCVADGEIPGSETEDNETTTTPPTPSGHDVRTGQTVSTTADSGQSSPTARSISSAIIPDMRTVLLPLFTLHLFRVGLFTVS